MDSARFPTRILWIALFLGVAGGLLWLSGEVAERNAIANMITNGESKITALVCITEDGRVGSPCGACREYLMQLDKDSPDIRILTDYATFENVHLRDLIPDWWGTNRFSQPGS